jgi:hypothetical protein
MGTLGLPPQINYHQDGLSKETIAFPHVLTANVLQWVRTISKHLPIKRKSIQIAQPTLPWYIHIFSAIF